MEEGDDIWVTIRNPRILSPGEMAMDDVQIGPDGKPVVNAAATKTTYRMGAKLIVGMRVYDPTAPIELDASGEPLPSEPVLLPSRPGPEDVAKLPLEIISWLGTEIGKVNPPRTPESPGATGNPS